MSVDVSRIPNNSKFDPVREAILDLEQEISSGVAGVSSVNNQTGAVTIAQGSNVSITTNNGVITISSTASGGGTLEGELTLAAGDGIGLSSPSVFDGSTDLTVTITNTDRPNDGQLNIITGAGISTATGETWTQKNINYSIDTDTWASSAGASFSANAFDDANITIEHGNTSDVQDVVNVGGNVLQSMSFDQFGHVQSTASRNLDERYLIWRNIFTSNDNRTATAAVFNDTIEFKGAGSIAVTKSPTNDEIRFGLAVSDIRFEDGRRVARGFLYWQGNTEPTSGNLPSNASFSFDSYLITTGTEDWLEIPPFTGYSLTTYYITRYTSIDDGAGTTASRSVTFSAPQEATGFEGPVTFNSLSEELGSNGFTIIDGGRVKTGQIQSIGLNTSDLDQGLSVYTNQGSFFNLGTGDIVTMDFSVISGTGNFKGDLSAASGEFGTVRINKEVGGTDYAIFSSGFSLDLDGNVTIGGVTFPVIIFADDAAGNNRSLVQGSKQFALFTSSTTPPEDLTQGQIDAFTGTFVAIVGQDGADGVDGADGAVGLDGLSPTVDSVKVGDTTTITIYYDQNQNGVFDAGVDTLIEVFTVQDGADGIDGVNGQNGQSPTVSTSKVGNITTVTVFYDVNSNGVYDAGTDVLLDQFTVEDGGDGLAGTDGVSTFLTSIFRRSASFPATPSGGSYNFATTTLTPPAGWSITAPSGTDPLYVSTALANIQGTTGTDTTLNWSTPVILARDGTDGLDGADGVDGVDGVNGSNGIDGSNGVKTATGIIFYQIGSVSQPATPSASSFNFSTGQFVGLTSFWLPSTPDMAAGTATNRYWSSYYVAVETFAGSNTGTVSFETPIRSFSFNQVVTFSSLDTAGQTVINGENITTGIIKSANYVAQAASVFSSAGMAIDLDGLSIETPSFAIDSNGDAYYSSGDIQIGSNKITLKSANFFSSVGEIEFLNTSGGKAADIKATSFSINELTLASYEGFTTRNQLILAQNRFFLGDANDAFIRSDTISTLDYLIMFANRYELRGLTNTTASAANLHIDIFNNNLLSRSTSSLKYKKDVEDYDKGIESIKSLRPVYYRGKEDGDKRYAGLIAEEVHESGLDEFVMYDTEGEPDSLAYQNMVALLIKGMQEQQAQIENLTQEIALLKSKS